MRMMLWVIGIFGGICIALAMSGCCLSPYWRGSGMDDSYRMNHNIYDRVPVKSEFDVVFADNAARP